MKKLTDQTEIFEDSELPQDPSLRPSLLELLGIIASIASFAFLAWAFLFSGPN